jgi:hypothetical protein
VKDFTTFTAEERRKVEDAIERLTMAAGILSALVADPKDSGSRRNLIDLCDMNASFCPDRSLPIRSMLERIDANTCPECWGTPDLCECTEEILRETDVRRYVRVCTLPPGKLPNAIAARGPRNIGMEDEPEEYEPNPYDGTYSEV